MWPLMNLRAEWWTESSGLGVEPIDDITIIKNRRVDSLNDQFPTDHRKISSVLGVNKLPQELINLY